MDRNKMIQAVQDLRTYYERAIVDREIVGKRIAVPYADGSEGYALAYGPEGNEPLPTVINIHGGGYILYRPEYDDEFCEGMIDRIGSAVRIFSIGYRLAPEHRYPIPVEDAYTAVCWLFEHADELGIDVERVAISGHSAGAALATVMCLKSKAEQGPKFKCQVLDCGAYDIATSALDKPQPEGAISVEESAVYDESYVGDDKELAREPCCSPLYATAEQLRGLPPAMVITAELDSLAQEGVLYARNLAFANVEVEMDFYKNVGHTFSITSYEPPETPDQERKQALVLEKMAAFLERRLTE